MPYAKYDCTDLKKKRLDFNIMKPLLDLKKKRLDFNIIKPLFCYIDFSSSLHEQILFLCLSLYQSILVPCIVFF